MSAVCAAGAAILALSEDDLQGLASAKHKKLLERYVNIQLDCDLTTNGPEDSRGFLNVVRWSGSSDLCGGCPFCNVVVDGLRRECRHHGLHNHGQALPLPQERRYPETFRMRVLFKKLEYHRDPSKWLFGQKEEIMWDIQLLLLRGTATLTPSVRLEEVRAELRSVEVAFELFGEDDVISTIWGLHRRPLEPSTLSQVNITKIKSWITDCENDHFDCQNNMVRDFLPTRLLDVGDRSSGHHVRLIQSSDSLSIAPGKYKQHNYMALSYCWGPPEGSFTTTRETLPNRLSLITTDSMPQTFRDAVSLARDLGIRYVWIDSLCIIQDDKEDWQSESSKMAEIFSSAYLTVVSARGDSRTDSFLQRDHPLITCSVPLPTTDMISGHFGLRYRRHWRTDKMAEIIDGRWITRGWTFQEERLARRVLMFGENKFFFDCITLERMEDTDRCKGRPDWVETVRNPSAEDEFPAPSRADSNSYLFNNRTSFDHWQTLCSHYSRRVLTFSSDKLPAISGIAKQTAKRVQSDYLAGLWREHLMHDLFWHTKHLAERPDTYRAPSWSWASVDGHISWPTWRWCAIGECEQFFQILEARTDVLGVDPYGAVKAGHLKISGKLIDIDRPAVDDMLPSSRGQTWYPTYDDKPFASARLDVALPSADMEKRLYALLVAKCKVRKGKDPLPRGLILEMTGGISDDGLDEYRRVGIFRVSPEEEEQDYLNAWEASQAQIIVIV